MATSLRTALRRALAGAPCTLRELARAAGVAHSTLLRIQTGERPASPAVAARVAGALRTWGTRCTALADALERAASAHKED